LTALQKSFSHREEATLAPGASAGETTKIFKKKFKNPKNFFGFLSFFFAIIKLPSCSSLLRGNQDVFTVDSSL
jgi:hypothetical protein